jgi:hypothetical protein
MCQHGWSRTTLRTTIPRCDCQRSWSDEHNFLLWWRITIFTASNDDTGTITTNNHADRTSRQSCKHSTACCLEGCHPGLEFSQLRGFNADILQGLLHKPRPKEVAYSNISQEWSHRATGQAHYGMRCFDGASRRKDGTDGRLVMNLCAYEYTPPSVNTMIIEQLSN